MFERKPVSGLWNGRIEPFCIINNVYFVGTYHASTHLIDTGDGLILIDPGYSDDLYMVMDSIHRLGFDPLNIKYIVNTHWHGDHTEATKALAGFTGAKTLIGRDDVEKAKKYFDADIIVSDGDTLELGNTKMEFMETPGHTKGCISFFFMSGEYRVGMFGGAGANTMASGHFDYDGCREGYRASIERLRHEKVDVFIGNHVWNNDTERKSLRMRETGENPFIDDKIWCEFLNFCENRLDKVIESEK